MNGNSALIVGVKESLLESSLYSYLGEISVFSEVVRSTIKHLISEEVYYEGITHVFITYKPKGISAQVINTLRARYQGIFITFICQESISSFEIRFLINCGINGILNIEAHTNELKECIEAYRRDDKYFCSSTRNIIFQEVRKPTYLLSLTKMQVQILEQAVQGRTINETAMNLGVSIYAIIYHRKNMMKKAGVNNITEMIVKAIKSGIL
jgi:DNA-binding NarL/FixJ family response regulator